MSTRRENVPFDPYHFEKKRLRGTALSTREVFERIYSTNHWHGPTSVSGEGADRMQTRALEAALPALLADLGVETLLDLPCGDYSWMKAVDLPVRHYVGADIVPELVARNQAAHGDARHRFVVLDLTTDPLPAADLLLCRDCLVHLSFADVARAFDNLRAGDVPYLLTTTFPGCDANEDIATGDWRPLNLERPPFSFPPPLALVDEQCSEGGGQFRDKSLGLWRVDDLTPRRGRGGGW